MILSTLLCLAGCSTPYQEMGILGGVSSAQMTQDVYRISARGNGYTGRNAVVDYTLLKAAETTKNAGGTHFEIVTADDASRTGSIVTPGSAHTTYGMGSAHTTFTPATAHEYVMPGQDMFIRVMTLPAGSPPPPKTLSADEIIQFIGPRVARA